MSTFKVVGNNVSLDGQILTAQEVVYIINKLEETLNKMENLVYNGVAK